MAETIETRPFPPFLPKKATVMMMGTFPPEQSKRAMEFHYPNFQNDMWRVFGLVFFDEKDHFRNGEEIPDCKHIGTTGGKATEILLSLLPEKVKLPKTGETIPFVFNGRELTLTRLPSTSRAYPLSLPKKAEAYKNFFKACGLKTK